MTAEAPHVADGPVRDVRIEHDPKQPWRGKLFVGGVDLSHHVQGYHIDFDTGGQLPQVILRLSHRADGALFEGLAHVSIGEVDDDGAVERFLAGIDPEKLEEAAMNRDDLGRGPGELTAAMLRQLAEWARGD